MELKNYVFKIKVLPLISFLLINLAGITKGQSCTGGTSNIPRAGSVTINGVTINSSYTGDVQSWPSAYSVCSGNVTTSANSLLVGRGNFTFPTNPSPWNLTLNFDKPVNNLVIALTATGSDASPSSNENFVFNTNGGSVSITAGTNCYSTISSNTIYSGGGAPVQVNGGGGGLFRITSPTSYTQLTINGNGGLNGSLLALCASSIQVACSAGTVYPAVSTFINNICPSNTVNLNTQAHIGTIPANSNLVWYTNSSHTGGPYATPTAATTGTYYAFYYDSVNNCYSPASAAVTVFNSVCGVGCNNTMYLSQADTLFRIGTSTNPFTYPNIGTASVNYNAIGLNPLDGKIYGMQVSLSNNLLIINPDGTSTNLGAISGLPSATYNTGEIDNAGNYYVKQNTNSNQLYKINLTTKTAILISLSSNVNLSDLGYSITTGLLYGVNSINGQLTTINPITGVVSGIGITPGAVQFGAMYTSSTGEVFGVNNNGGFYQFNLNTGERVLISGAPASSANDGAHCVTVPITFNADLSVTKTDDVTTYASGTNTTYKIIVANNGPYGVLNATVSDPVPTGIPAGNISYTAIASSGATTSVSGTQTGPINDYVGIPVGGSITYTVVVNIPFNFNGNLTNTVTVAPPSNITDPNLANNTASDTDIQAVCYRPGATNGTALETNHGITSLNRAGNDTTGNSWPMVRKGAWMALEAKTKGLVINRLTSAQISSIPVTNIIEGMMVYNTTLKCLQINTTGTSTGWTCINTPTCPSN